MFALIDCNNFFVSCERAIDRSLENKPVVVLSNNDGCVVSRSNEVKSMGVPMSAPYFKWKDLFQREGVKVFSSNFSLYEDYSRWVIQIIKSLSLKYHVYSIDEVFVDLEGFPRKFAESQCQKMQERIWERAHIPVSVGIAPSKTLAKVANEHSKKQNNMVSLYNQGEIDYILGQTSVIDVWGIGWRSARKLQHHNIINALQFSRAEDGWLRKHFSINGLRIAHELRGVSCIELSESHTQKKSITSSRSFGKLVQSFTDMREAVAHYATRAAAKLRAVHEVTNEVSVWITTNRHRKQDRQYSNSYTIKLSEPTAYTGAIIDAAISCLQRVYRSGYNYKKASVHLTNLQRDTTYQKNLFTHIYTDKHIKIMQAVDTINQDLGSVYFAAAGVKRGWKGRRDFSSNQIREKHSDNQEHIHFRFR